MLCDKAMSWNLVVDKERLDIWENCVAQVMKGKNHRGVVESLRKHCKKEKHKFFYYFLAKEITRPPSTFVQVQKSMIAGLETCGGVIPFPCVASAISGDQTMLNLELSKIFGAALHHNRSNLLAKMKRLKNYTKEEVTQPQFKVFKEHCRMLLNEIHASLMGFDWTSFCQMNVKIFQVWNGINLFLR